MPRRYATLLLSLAGISACRADPVAVCSLVGLPAIELTAVDAASGAPVALTGSTLAFTTTHGAYTADTRAIAIGSRNIWSECCATGPVSIHLAQTGYSSWDSVVVVPTVGRCEDPVLQHVLARLR